MVLKTRLRTCVQPLMPKWCSNLSHAPASRMASHAPRWCFGWTPVWRWDGGRSKTSVVWVVWHTDLMTTSLGMENAPCPVKQPCLLMSSPLVYSDQWRSSERGRRCTIDSRAHVCPSWFILHKETGGKDEREHWQQWKPVSNSELWCEEAFSMYCEITTTVTPRPGQKRVWPSVKHFVPQQTWIRESP